MTRQTYWTVVLLLSSFVSNADGEQESGVRARLYWIGLPIAPSVMIDETSSPNVDLRIDNLRVREGEKWFQSKDRQYQQNYILRLDTNLSIEAATTVEFRVDSAAATRFRIDEQPVEIEDGTSKPTRLRPGSHSLTVYQYVNQESQSLRLTWRQRDEEQFSEVPGDRLKTEKFYFRPTNGSAKRIVSDQDRPGKFEKVIGVHPSFDLLTLHPEDIEVPVGGLAEMSDGRLVVATFDARRLRAPRPQQEPDGELWLYSGVDKNNGQSIKRTRIAKDLYEPSGVCVVDDAIYVSQRSEVTRFDYAPKANAWNPTTVATGWDTNDFHALSFGLLYEQRPGSPGYLWMARGTGLGLMKNPPEHGSVWRIDLSRPVGSNVTAITGGHRTPNGIGFGPGKSIFVTDNQGEWTPVNELNHVQQGKFYGFFHDLDRGGDPTPFQPDDDDDPSLVTQPAVLMPQDEIGNSPSEPAMIPDYWPYAGQMVVGDVKYGGVNRLSLQEVDGQWQGAAYRFTQGLKAGINRLTFSASGDLFVGGIGGDHATTWNWVDPQGEKTYQGLQRLRPNNKSTFDIQLVEATADGFRVTFTQSIEHAWLSDPGNFEVHQWRYEATKAYGGPKLDEQQLEVAAATPNADGTTVELSIPEATEGYVVHFLIDPISKQGQPIWSCEAWYTLNRKP